MPARKHLSRSSFRERAVKAMTGRWPPAVRSRSRIASHDLEAVQFRHVDVQEQQVEAFALQEAQRLPTVNHHCRREPLAGQHVLKKIPVELVVLGDQDAQRHRPSRPPGRVAAPRQGCSGKLFRFPFDAP